MGTPGDMNFPLVVDCDAGLDDAGLDDAWSILLFLANQKRCRLLGITSVNGNTSVFNVSQNVGRLLAVTSSSHIPLYVGAKTPLLTAEAYDLPADFLYFHGRNGFGDVELPSCPDMVAPQSENAVAALNRMASEYKRELIVVCLGPLTNIALAIRTYPDFVNNVKQFYIMGGNYTAAGNTTMCAEFNFHCDPEAAHIVLSAASDKITLLPWETCLATKIPYEWRASLTAGGGPVLELMDKIEAPVIERGKRLGLSNWINCDQLLASIVLDESIVESRFKCYATVEVSGVHTRGQVVIDHMHKKKADLTVVKQVNVEKHKNNLWELRNRFPK